MAKRTLQIVALSTLLAALVPGCGSEENVGVIAMQVKAGIAEKTKDDTRTKDFEVVDVFLVRESPSKLTGNVEFKYRGQTEQTDLVVRKGSSADMKSKIEYEWKLPRKLLENKDLLDRGRPFR